MEIKNQKKKYISITKIFRLFYLELKKTFVYILFTNKQENQQEKERQEKSQQTQQAVFLCLVLFSRDFLGWKMWVENNENIPLQQLRYLIDYNVHSVPHLKVNFLFFQWLAMFY